MLDQDTISAKTEWFQVKIRIGTKKKDGPVSGLKSAGPRGRFQSLGASGPVSRRGSNAYVSMALIRAEDG